MKFFGRLRRSGSGQQRAATMLAQAEMIRHKREMQIAALVAQRQALDLKIQRLASQMPSAPSHKVTATPQNIAAYKRSRALAAQRPQPARSQAMAEKLRRNAENKVRANQIAALRRRRW